MPRPGATTLDRVHQAMILFAAGRNQPFSVVQTDGSSVKRLTVMSGELAPSWQRAISRDGTAVFTSPDPISTQPGTAANV